MIYRGPGLLAVVWFGSFPQTPPPLFLSLPVCRRSSLLMVYGGGGGGGRSKSYDGGQAWYFMNDSIPSGGSRHIHIMPEPEERGQKQLVLFSSIFSDQQRPYSVSICTTYLSLNISSNDRHTVCTTHFIGLTKSNDEIFHQFTFILWFVCAFSA